jgi:hypothetical protein
VIDEYEDDPGRPARDKRSVNYGQVQSYTYVTLPAMPCLKTDRDSTAILALITLCKTNGKDASLEPVWYQDMGTVRVFDIAMIDCVVGRVKLGNRWGIVDRSLGLEHAAIHGVWGPEYESEAPVYPPGIYLLCELVKPVPRSLNWSRYSQSFSHYARHNRRLGPF